MTTYKNFKDKLLEGKGRSNLTTNYTRSARLDRARNIQEVWSASLNYKLDSTNAPYGKDPLKTFQNGSYQFTFTDNRGKSHTVEIDFLFHSSAASSNKNGYFIIDEVLSGELVAWVDNKMKTGLFLNYGDGQKFMDKLGAVPKE